MTALKSEGVCLYISDDTGSPSLRVLIGEVTDFTGPGGSAAVIDVTHLKSTAKEKLIGLPDEGQISMNLNLDPADPGQREAWEARAGQEERTFELELTDVATTVLIFAGFVLEFSMSAGVDDKISASITIEITGSIAGFPVP